MSLNNENFNIGGTGAEIFANTNQARVVKNHGQSIGESYKAPVGLPEWKQPSFDGEECQNSSKKNSLGIPFLAR